MPLYSLLFILFSRSSPLIWVFFSIIYILGYSTHFYPLLLLSSFPWFFCVENTWLIIFTCFKALCFWSSSSISWYYHLCFSKFLCTEAGFFVCLVGWLVGYLLFLLQWRRYSFCSVDSVWKDYWSLEVSWGLSERLIWVYSQLSHSFSPQGTSVLSINRTSPWLIAKPHPGLSPLPVRHTLVLVSLDYPLFLCCFSGLLVVLSLPEIWNLLIARVMFLPPYGALPWWSLHSINQGLESSCSLQLHGWLRW